MTRALTAHRPGRSSRPLALLLAAVVASSALAACGKDDPPKATVGVPEYVAFGDSYTAGPGILPLSDKPCGRSETNYPTLVAEALDITAFTDASCGGASTADLKKAQTAGYVRLNDPQLDALDRRTRLVTIGLGLNNEALAINLLVTCLTPASGETTDRCQAYLKVPQAAVDAKIARAAAQVEDAITTIRSRAPEAEVVLVGYPRVAPDTGSCADLPMPTAMVDRLRAAMKGVDDAWRAAARRAGAEYVDMYTPSQGHDICSAEPWVNGAFRKPDAVPMHPFESYHRAVAAQIVALLEK